MSNNFVSFISDEHLINCIANLHKSYLRAKNNVTKRSFYANKIDTFKLTFDSRFNNISEGDLIQTEILRQIDKSINNSIGTFHEEILGGIEGFEVGKLSGFDIRAIDDSLFAIFGNTDIPKNVSDGVFEKLANTARIYKKANFYYVRLDDYSPLNEKWVIGNDESSISHKHVFKISLAEFYSVVSGQKQAFEELTNALPIAIKQFLAIPQPS